jgi:hypothetical protein
LSDTKSGTPLIKRKTNTQRYPDQSEGYNQKASIKDKRKNQRTKSQKLVNKVDSSGSDGENENFNQD